MPGGPSETPSSVWSAASQVTLSSSRAPLQDVPVGRDHLRHVPLLVQGQQHHAGRARPDAQFARRPRRAGARSRSHRRGRSCAGSSHSRPRGSVRSSGSVSLALKKPATVHSPKGLPDLQREDRMAVGVEQVHRPRRLAVRREDLLQNLEPARVQVRQAVAGEQVAAGEGDQRGGGLGLRRASAGSGRRGRRR